LGLVISDCGLVNTTSSNPKSKIQNPKSRGVAKAVVGKHNLLAVGSNPTEGIKNKKSASFYREKFADFLSLK
jgi:hypothetical protein